MGLKARDRYERNFFDRGDLRRMRSAGNEKKIPLLCPFSGRRETVRGIFGYFFGRSALANQTDKTYNETNP